MSNSKIVSKIVRPFKKCIKVYRFFTNFNFYENNRLLISKRFIRSSVLPITSKYLGNKGCILLSEKDHNACTFIAFQYLYNILLEDSKYSTWFVSFSKGLDRLCIGSIDDYPNKTVLKKINMKYLSSLLDVIDFLAYLHLLKKKIVIVINKMHDFVDYGDNKVLKMIAILKIFSDQFVIVDEYKKIELYKSTNEMVSLVKLSEDDHYVFNVLFSNGESDYFRRRAEFHWNLSKSIIILKKFDFALELTESQSNVINQLNMSQDTTQDDEGNEDSGMMDIDDSEKENSILNSIPNSFLEKEI